MPQHRVLITGFEPFASATRNPSGVVVHALNDLFPPEEIVTEILPVEYSAAESLLGQLIDRHRPAAWIGFGLSNRATAITLERTAVNLDDAMIPDNAGELRRGEQIDPHGPETFGSTLPLDAMADSLRCLKIPVEFSDNAGRFVCNHVFYCALSIASRNRSLILAGFIHIPWPSDWELPSQNAHNVTLETMIQAARTYVSTVLQELHRENILAT